MKLTICDCCGKEGAKNKFEYLVHLDDVAENGYQLHGYCDLDGNYISGKYVSVDLCNKCYNDIVIKSVVEFKQNKVKYEENPI